MPARKYKEPDYIGISTSKETKQRFDDLCSAYRLNRGDMFFMILEQWIELKNMKPLTG